MRQLAGQGARQGDKMGQQIQWTAPLTDQIREGICAALQRWLQMG